MSTSHHFPGGDPRSEAELKRIMSRFLSQAEGTARREYPKGRIGAADDGELALAVTGDRDRGIISIHFGKPVAWVGLKPEEVAGLVKLLVRTAREVSTSPLTIDL